MGITGLLPYLKAIQRDVNVSSLKGLKAGIDAYCWLHRGAYSCATQIVMETAKIETLPFIKYCVKRVNLLRQHDITPIVVFDGGYLPTKAHTEKERRQKRQTYKAKGKELLKQGKKSEAHDCFQKCVDISPEMALAFIKECRKLDVQCIVAPYEADAQLAYLSKEGLVDVVITEDSDLLVFGAKRVLYKMDEFGNGKLVEIRDLGKANKNIIGFTEDTFRQMCILSGCDYLPSVPGIGLGKAAKLLRKHNKNPTQAIRALRCENSQVPSDYDVNFKKAEYTFLYQLVFDPRTQQQVRLNKLPEGIDPKEFEFAGVEHSPRKAVHMARGNINPITMEFIDSYSPSKAGPTSRKPPTNTTSWSGSAMGSANKKYPVAIQAKLPITSSTRLSRPFKPPGRTKPQATPTERVDGVLRDDELLRMYADGGEVAGEGSSPKQVQPDASGNDSGLSLSKYFGSAEDTYSDVTPDETDSAQLKQCARILQHSDEQGSGLVSTPCVSISAASAQTGPKKRLFSSTISKLSQYVYSGSKKRRSEDGKSQSPVRRNPFAMSTQRGGEEGEATAPPVKRNPFAMSAQDQRQTGCEDSSVYEPVCSPGQCRGSSQSYNEDSATLSPVQISATSYSSDSSPSPSEPASSACPLSPVVKTLLSNSVSSVTMTTTSTPIPSAERVTSTTDPVSPVAMATSCEDTVTSAVVATSSFSSAFSISRSSSVKNKSWSGFGSTQTPSIGSKKPRQATRKVGLSKKAKPARLSTSQTQPKSESGQSQLSFAAYSFVGKSKMQI